MTTEEKCINFVRQRLLGHVVVVSVERVNKLPKGFFFIDWSLGGIEVTYFFEVRGAKGEVVLCQVSVILDYFIWRAKFFHLKDEKYVRMQI